MTAPERLRPHPEPLAERLVKVGQIAEAGIDAIVVRDKAEPSRSSCARLSWMSRRQSRSGIPITSWNTCDKCEGLIAAMTTRIVDINALRALAPLPRAPVPRPSRPPVPLLEPEAQRTLTSGRTDRARPAVSGMLGAHTAAVKRQMTRYDSRHCAHLPILVQGHAQAGLLNRAALWIEAQRALGRPVLVHCAAGHERSPLTVAWLLARRHK